MLVTYHDDLAICLEHKVIGTIIQSAYVRHLLAIPAKGEIQSPIGIVAHQGDVTTATDTSIACCNNFSIGLYGDPVSYFDTAKVGRELAISTEGGIRRPIRVIADQGKITIAAACHHDLAIGLDRDRGNIFLFWPGRSDTGNNSPIPTKRCVQADRKS